MEEEKNCLMLISIPKKIYDAVMLIEKDRGIYYGDEIRMPLKCISNGVILLEFNIKEMSDIYKTSKFEFDIELTKQNNEKVTIHGGNIEDA